MGWGHVFFMSYDIFEWKLESVQEEMLLLSWKGQSGARQCHAAGEGLDLLPALHQHGSPGPALCIPQFSHLSAFSVYSRKGLRTMGSSETVSGSVSQRCLCLALRFI